MSIWTHVTAVVRYDGLSRPTKAQVIKEVLEPLLGKTALFDDSENAWDECEVPMGSEGSISWRIYPGEEDEQLEWGSSGNINLATVVIEGDLRDFEAEGRYGPDDYCYGDWSELREYFHRVTSPAEGFGVWVRQGVMLLESGDKHEVIEYLPKVEKEGLK